VCPDSAVDEWIARLLRRQIETGFADLRGADAAFTVPFSERLLNDVLAEILPRSGAVREPYVSPEAGDRFQVRVRLSSPSFLPPLRLRIAIDRQPELPTSPVLVLRLERTGLLTLAGPILRLINALPDGVAVKDDRIYVDLRAMLERHHLAQYLEYVKELRINTVEGAMILAVRGRVS
jgi:hypothetical protein